MQPHIRPLETDRLEAFTRSEVFARTFREGMDLVEETAAYLDGPGRADSRRLGTDAAVAYATQSMRLTTHLMQVASWLLLQRSVQEGEMSVAEAGADKYRLHADAGGSGLSFQEIAAHAAVLPGTLLDLMARSDSLHGRIVRLDRSLYGTVAAREGRTVADQMARLNMAFEGEQI